MSIIIAESSGVGGVTIGNPVSGGTAQNILYVDASGNLAQLAPGNDGNVLYVSGGAFTSTTKEAAGVLAFNRTTKDTLLATTPTVTTIGLTTDTNELFIYDLTNAAWYKVPFFLKTDTSSPDMGYLQDSSRNGYHDDYITDKTIHNSAIRGNVKTENGGIRIDTTQDPDTFEIYLRNAWQTILYDLTYESGYFKHAPVSEDIKVWSGMSVSLGLNGRPIVNEYKVSMGAYPPPRVIDGGTF